YEIANPDTAHAARNPEYAKLVVNGAATAAIVKMTTRDAPRLGTHIMEGPPRMAEPGSVQEPAPTEDRPSCYTWRDQQKPTYPANGRHAQRFGAVLMVFDIARDGTLKNVRPAATAPDPMWPGFVNSITRAHGLVARHRSG